MAAEWEWRVTERDLTRVGSFCMTEDIGELVDGLGFDPDTIYDDLDACTLKESKNDVSSGTATLPLDSPANDWMVEDRLLLLYQRGQADPTTGALIGVADDDLLLDEHQRGRFAAYGLTHLNDLGNEAIIFAARGPKVLPPGDDRILDSSDPHYDASGWANASEYETVADANGGTPWPLTPIAGGMPPSATSVAKMIGPPGFDETGTPAPPPGTYYYRVDFEITDGGTYRGFVTGDDGHGPMRVDGTDVASSTLVNQFGNVEQFDIELSEGFHTFWCPVVQSEDPMSPGDGDGPSAFAFSLHQRLQNDEVDVPVLVSDASWSVWTDVDNTPGFTPGKMGKVAQFEAVARAAFLAPTLDFDEDVDSDGNAWAGEITRSTKTGTSMATFFGKEMGDDTIDTVFAVIDGAVTWRMWPKGRDTSVAFELVPGENIGGLTISRARTEVTAALARGHDMFYEVSTAPAAGHPRKEKLLQVGAAQNEAEVVAVASPQLDLFGRIREKLAITHVTGRQTPDAEMPGLAYWVFSKFLVPVARDFSTGEVEVISETVTLLGSGQLAFTAEFGDVIVPPEGRPGLALHKLAPGLRSRASAPVSF